MNRRPEPCRNFLRGSCKYGASCKFLHTTQKQANPNNPFGFGTQSNSPFTQSQQQKPNPFGFGVKNNTSQQQQIPAKPVENKWTRSSSLNPPKHNESQSQPSVHVCTDAESCKKLIAEDYRNEAPLWKLTCYGHRKNGPCDIVGDVSFEELRAVAYDEARQGRTLQSILERERNLLQSKLSEFDNFLRNPQMLQNPSLSANVGPPPFAGSQSNNGSPPVFTSFAQLGAAANNVNVASGFRPPAAAATPSNTTIFGQISASPEIKFGAPGMFGSGQLQIANQNQNQNQNHNQNQMFSPGPHISRFGNNSFNASGGQQSTTTTNTNASKVSLSILGGPILSATTANQPTVEDNQEGGKDDSIWLKKQWSVGEIPEERAPPSRFC